jgi:large subunit ribosomal protein L1
MFISVPHKIKDKKICGFFEVKNSNVDTITRSDFKKYSAKQEVKRLARQYDFFIAQASLMPVVATTFGRSLGPTGKMPSPQLGIIMDADDRTINDLKNRINTSVKVKVKEASIKVSAGRQSMKDEEIIENILTIYNAVLKVMTKGKENIKNIEIKFTMTKPQKIKLK